MFAFLIKSGHVGSVFTDIYFLNILIINIDHFSLYMCVRGKGVMVISTETGMHKISSNSDLRLLICINSLAIGKIVN